MSLQSFPTIFHIKLFLFIKAPREDRRNLAKCVKPLHYGPFSSYAPAYDGTFATLTKDESHLIYHTLRKLRVLISIFFTVIYVFILQRK